LVVEKISSRQFTWLIIAMGISTPTLMMPAAVIFACKQNAWLALLLATLAAALVVILNVALARQFPAQTISQYAQILLGTWLGKLVGIFYGLVCLAVGGLATRTFSQLLKIGIMPETPLWAFVLGLTLLAVYSAWQGIEPIARINDLIVPFTLAALAVLLLEAMPDAQAYRGLPILQFDFSEIIKGSFTPYSYLAEVFVILLLAPALNKPEELRSSVLKGIILSGLILMITTQSILFVLGSFRASAYLFPLLNIATELHILEVFERLEPLLLSAWLTVVIIKISLFAYLFALSTSQVFGQKTKNPLLLISLLAIPAIALAPRSLAEHRKIWVELMLFKTLLPLAAIIIPALLLIIAKVKKKHG
jgi:spore germination protein KB